MADHIRYDYPKMEEARKKLVEHGKEMSTAADTLKSSMATAVANWTGPSKDAFVLFINYHVHKYLTTEVPNVANQLATLLQYNMQTMGDTDDAVAASVPK